MEEKKYTAEEALNLQSSAYQKGYNEGYQFGKSATWAKATKENMRRSAILRDSVLPENHIHQWAIRSWDDKGVLFTNKAEKEWWELEILDESEAAPSGEREVAFAEWIREQNYKPYAGWWYLNGNNYANQPCSTAELYELFKQQKEK